MIITRLLKFWRQKPPHGYYSGLEVIKSPIERIFWDSGHERLSKVGKFSPQTEIGPYRADFTITNIPRVPTLKIAIELDGHEWHSSPGQRDSDTSRERYFQRRGWQVIRFTGSQVYGDCQGCVNEVIELVEAWSKWLRR